MQKEELEVRIACGMARLEMLGKKGQNRAAYDVERRIRAYYACVRIQNHAHKIKVFADAGFQGLVQDMPDAMVFTPYKKTKTWPLSPEQKKFNRILSQNRTIAENAIGSVKRFKRASAPYNGSPDQFNDEFNIMAGLENLRTMLRNGTYEHWAKKLGLYIPDKGAAD